MLPAVGVHGPQILQESSLTQVVHKSLQHLFELRGVEPILVMGPPGVPELLSPVAEVHSDMSNAAKPLVLLRRHGIKLHAALHACTTMNENQVQQAGQHGKI